MPIGMSIHPLRYGADERSSSFTTDSADEPRPGAGQIADCLVPPMMGELTTRPTAILNLPILRFLFAICPGFAGL
jgi:hypothetical protein